MFWCGVAYQQFLTWDLRNQNKYGPGLWWTNAEKGTGQESVHLGPVLAKPCRGDPNPGSPSPIIATEENVSELN